MIAGFVLALALVTAGQGSSEQTGPVLERARAEYRSGDYEQAKHLWESWLTEHPEGDGRVFYNLGNCEYRLHDYARALWRYEQASRLLGHVENLTFNRSLAQQRLSVDVSHTGGLWDSVQSSVGSWRAGTWFWLGAAMQVVGLAVLWRAFSRPTRLRVVISVLLLVSGSLAVGQSRSHRLDEPRGVIVLAQRTPLRAEPRPELPAVTWIGAGVRADYVAETPDWLRVRVRGRDGWIPRERGGVF